MKTSPQIHNCNHPYPRRVSLYVRSERGKTTVIDGNLPKELARDLDGTFEQVVLAYQRRLYAFALRYTGSAQDAEEIVQDAFVRAYRALATYGTEQIRSLALRPWLFQITVNVARNRARGKRVTSVPMDDGAVPIEPADDDDGPQTRAERTERDAELAARVAALPDPYRGAVILRHMNDLSYAEVATLLGRPVGTVKSDVHRGLALLRAALERELSEVI